MERLKKVLRKIFSLPPLPTVITAVFGFGFVLAVAIFKIEIPALQYLSYVSSAYALIITITAFPRFIAFVKLTKRRVIESAFMKKIRGTAFGERFFGDIRFRTELSMYGSLIINFLYIAIKLFSGIYYRSVWFVSLAAYYILLAIMRFILLHKNKKSVMTMETELKRYRLCGIMLLIMNQALVGIVIFMVHQNKGFDYPGLLIYAMAAYSFYSIITAVINLVKFRKRGSPLLSAAKVINLVAAMVSVLSLETAMLAQFGGDNDMEFRRLMTGLTGGGVCIIVIAMAAFMLWKSARQLKKLKAATKGETENEQGNL
ncbi:MAG: hypothetical protein HDR72_03235 [Ruminococcaceae bacterium]|nr:hypothetical protein [Oscillospiraceae bacterium]